MKKLIIKLFTLTMVGGAFFHSIPSQAGTGVYVNGLELNYRQWVAASRLVGGPVAPGAYWYNSWTGAYGRIGSYNNGGDHFHSSGYSAGNSNADNSAGYVSVPGYGPVSYGM